MNRTQLLQLSADLDRVIQFGFFGNVKSAINARRAADPEVKAAFKGLRRVGKAIAGPAGIGAGVGAITGGVTGALSDDPDSSAIGGAFKGAAIGGSLGAGAGAASGAFKNNSAMQRLARMKRGAAARTQYVPPAGGMMGAPMLSAKTENLLTLSAELDQVINFDFMSMVKKYGPAVGKSAMKWGGIGAAGGAVAGGVSGALSDDPNKTALGGAMSGAMAGGTLGALGGAGMRGMKINSAINKAATMKAARLAGTPGAAAAPSAAAAPTATAAADQMAAAAAQPAKAAAAVGKPSAYAEMPSGNASFVQPRHVTDPMGYGIGGNTINPMPGKINAARTTSALRDPNTSVADALTNKRKAIYENGMNTPRGMKNPTVFSSRLQSLVQLNAELDQVIEFEDLRGKPNRKGQRPEDNMRRGVGMGFFTGGPQGLLAGGLEANAYTKAGAVLRKRDVIGHDVVGGLGSVGGAVAGSIISKGKTAAATIGGVGGYAAARYGISKRTLNKRKEELQHGIMI